MQQLHPTHTHRCARCGTGIRAVPNGTARTGRWTTGFPSHLATNCAGSVERHVPLV